MRENKYTKEQLRIKAIELYSNKWKVSEICKTLNCSRRWFYKWLKRNQSNDVQWYIEKSRKPKTSEKKIDLQTEQQIIETRKQLMITLYMQYGPQAIRDI